MANSRRCDANLGTADCSGAARYLKPSDKGTPRASGGRKADGGQGIADCGLQDPQHIRNPRSFGLAGLPKWEKARTS